jgi:O-antigen/teichoic acid export membrane protein
MFKKIAFTFGIKVLIAILNLAIVVMLSRSIGAAGKGEASLIVTSVAMILLFCNVIGGSSLVYFVPRHNILQLFLLSNVWSVIVCVFSYVIFLFFPLVPPMHILPVIILSLINSFLATNLTILLGKEKINTHNLVSLFQVVVNSVVLWFMFRGLDQNNVESYIYSLYAAMGVCLVLSSILIFPVIRNDKSEKETGVITKLFNFGAYSQAGHIMKFISFRCTFYLLATYSGDEALGIFSNGTSLIESIFLISNSIATVLYPKVSNSPDMKYARDLTLQLTRLSILLCIIALIPLMLLPSSFFTWLFGKEFSGVSQVILVLAPGILFYNIALILGHYFSGVGKVQVNAWANLTGLITTIICALISYPHFGILGIGIISSVSYFTTSAFIILYFKRETGIAPIQMLPRLADFKHLRSEAAGLLKK